jgi:hypothetical protein
MNTQQKGQLSVLKVELEALRKGYLVSRPTTDARYDLVVDTGDRLYRVQVKYGDGKSTHSSGCVTVSLRHYIGNSKTTRPYLSSEIDIIAAYVPKIDRVCWIPPEKFHGKDTIFLRLEPPKNGQTKDILMAEDFFW